jgi:CRISPR/Cas system CSM-associated protein Csm3 (group 7 of RAMP superfamily)
VDDKEIPCGCIVCQLLGDVTPTDNTGTDEQGRKIQARASRLYVFDAVLNQTFEISKTSKVFTSTTIRDGVGINRTTGAAAETAKFDLEVLPAGTIFDLHLELRSYHPDDPITETDRHLLAITLSEWQAGRVWLGGRVARGLGGFKLENLKIIERDLNDKDQLMTFLRQDNPWDENTENTDWLNKHLAKARQRVKVSTDDNPAITRRWIRAKFTLKATGPLVANDTTAATISGFDHAPLVVGLDNWRKPVLTGASLRGVIRSHAEKIARTLATIRVKNKAEFLQRCPACDPLVSRKPDSKEGLALESCDSLIKEWYGQLSAEEKRKFKEKDDVEDEHLCLACHLFGSPRRGSRLMVEDAVMEGKPDYKMLDFLAIDRFTGGGAEGLKFDALVLWRPQFKVRLYLENPQDWELGWLALTLRDMACGWLHVGMGAAKGLGQVKIEFGDLSLEMGFLGNEGFGSPVNSQASGIYQVAKFTPDVQDQWLEQAKKWVEEFKQKINNTKMTTRDGLPDSYFDRVNHLYPVEVRR